MSPCQNLYAFLRLRLGKRLSDREIARRWKMEWKSFSDLRHGRREVPRIEDLQRLASVLGIDAAFVFEVANGVPARKVHRLLEENDPEKLSRLLMAGAHAARQQNEASHRQFRALLDRVQDAIWTMDVQGRFQDFNRGLCAVTGLSADELRKRSFFDLLPGAQRAELVAAMASVFKNREERGRMLTVRAVGDAERLLEVDLSRIDDAEGHPIGIQGIARDVTERRRLESELGRKAETLETTFQAIPAAAILFSSDGTILLANRLVENVCEWTAAEIVGRNAGEVFGNPGPVGCPVTRSFGTGRFEQQISTVKNRSGAQVQVHRTAGPVLGVDGKVDGVVEIFVEVTEPLRVGEKPLVSRWNESLRTVNPRPAGRERRRVARVAVETWVKWQGNGEAGRARARNIGRGGMLLETKASLQTGTAIQLEWKLPGTERLVRAEGFVLWRVPAIGRGHAAIGIRFAEISRSSSAAIVRYIVQSSGRDSVSS